MQLSLIRVYMEEKNVVLKVMENIFTGSQFFISRFGKKKSFQSLI